MCGAGGVQLGEKFNEFADFGVNRVEPFGMRRGLLLQRFQDLVVIGHDGLRLSSITVFLFDAWFDDSDFAVRSWYGV